MKETTSVIKSIIKDDRDLCQADHPYIPFEYNRSIIYGQIYHSLLLVSMTHDYQVFGVPRQRYLHKRKFPGNSRYFILIKMKESTMNIIHNKPQITGAHYETK